jgi:hypothetical protein
MSLTWVNAPSDGQKLPSPLPSIAFHEQIGNFLKNVAILGNVCSSLPDVAHTSAGARATAQGMEWAVAQIFSVTVRNGNCWDRGVAQLIQRECATDAAILEVLRGRPRPQTWDQSSARLIQTGLPDSDLSKTANSPISQCISI